MTKTNKLHQFLKRVLRASSSDIQISPRSSRRMSSVFSRESSRRSSWSSSHRSLESVNSGISSDANYDCEDEDLSSPPHDVPAGCFPVYVGMERRRFVIPTLYLGNNVFRALLAKSEEEYGLRCEGGLRIACSPDVFEQFSWWMAEGGTTHCPGEITEHSSSGRFE